MAIGDIYQVTDVQEQNGVEILNVWYMESTAAPSNAASIGLGFANQWIDAITQYQEQSCVHTEVRVKNLFDPTDAHVQGISFAGDLFDADQAIPNFVALPLRLTHGNPTIRQGAKRLSGFQESQIGSFGTVDATFLTNIDTTFDTLLLDGVQDAIGGQEIARIVVVKLVKEIVNGITGYRLPESLVEAVFSVVEDIITKTFFTTQSSRKK